MKKRVLLVCSIMAVLMGYSCSSDDNSSIVEEEANLVGEWQLEAVDFSYIEEVGRPYGSDFCIMEYIVGYDFKEDGSFIFVVTHDLFGTNSGYMEEEQVWDWTGDETDFSLNSLNPGLTNGIDFGLDPTNINIEKVGDEWVLTFQADMFLGSTGDFTLVKKEIDREDHRPTLTYNGDERDYCGVLDFMLP